MKKAMKVISGVLAAATVCAFTAACDNENAAEMKIVNPRTEQIVIGYTDYEPMNYKDKDGVLTGFDTELAVMTFEMLGYNVRFKEIEWSNKYVELEGGTIDCVWNGFTWNCSDDDGTARSEKIDFSVPYMQNAQCVVRGASEAEITNESQFDGKSVSFENGSAGESYISDIEGVNINKKGVVSQMDAIKNVNNGTAQYAIVDVLLAEKLAGKGDYTNVVINTGVEIEKEEYAVGFKKNSELTAKVNLAFEYLTKSGYTLKLAQKYGLENSLLLTQKDA